GCVDGGTIGPRGGETRVEEGALRQRGLVISSALALSPQSVALGGTISGTVTYKNTNRAAITVNNILIAGRPPNFVPGVGPYDDFSPSSGPVTIAGGASYTLAASRMIA